MLVVSPRSFWCQNPFLSFSPSFLPSSSQGTLGKTEFGQWWKESWVPCSPSVPHLSYLYLSFFSFDLFYSSLSCRKLMVMVPGSWILDQRKCRLHLVACRCGYWAVLHSASKFISGFLMDAYIHMFFGFSFERVVMSHWCFPLIMNSVKS